MEEYWLIEENLNLGVVFGVLIVFSLQVTEKCSGVQTA